MTSFDFLKFIQTLLSLNGWALFFVAVTAVCQHWRERADFNGGYLTLVGLSIKWFPAALLYTYFAYEYWFAGQSERVFSPIWMSICFSGGLLIGGSLLVARFQPWIENKEVALIGIVILNTLLFGGMLLYGR